MPIYRRPPRGIPLGSRSPLAHGRAYGADLGASPPYASPFRLVLKLTLPGRFDRFSLVLYLLLGWSGVLIEPQPNLAGELKRERSAQVFAVACSAVTLPAKGRRVSSCSNPNGA